MKSRIAVGIFSIMTALCSLTVGGCSGSGNESAPPSAPDSVSSVSSAPSSPESALGEPPRAAEESAPRSEPTIFIGPNGAPVYDSDVTRLTSDDPSFGKKASELTAEDEGVTIFCEGFQYFKEPVGAAYNSYENPEMFDGFEFKSEVPVNDNPWKRVNVGDEICGLTLKSATTAFENYSKDNFDYYQTYYTCSVPDFSRFAEFDGSVTLTGFLNSSNRSSYEPDGGELRLTPTENKLPVMPAGIMYKIEPETYITAKSYGGGELYAVNEVNLIALNNPSGLDLGCIGIGDTACVRVTISNIKYLVAQSVTADLVDVEILSDVLAHEDDTI
ncbi:MAG: hypothetical protein NC299_02590 [Lachnospiraceae bacterium]|nr:hypothetical protein [Ruminococcus sp.]MCM1274238.1 hypothetical protein [Lachnospiraceae bacterium]